MILERTNRRCPGNMDIPCQKWTNPILERLARRTARGLPSRRSLVGGESRRRVG